MVLRAMSTLALLCMLGAVQAQPDGVGHGGPDGARQGSGMMGPDQEKMPGRRGGPGQQPMHPAMGPNGRGGLDRDGDGMISREEVRQQERALQQMRENWQRADRDGDGKLDQGEFAAFQQRLREGQQ